MKQKTNNVKAFWSNFRDVVVRSGIDSSNTDWYVKWAGIIVAVLPYVL